MSYDTIASLQRMQQLEQAQAATGKRLVLKELMNQIKFQLSLSFFVLSLSQQQCVYPF